jgi:hypothetical protein
MTASDTTTDRDAVTAALSERFAEVFADPESAVEVVSADAFFDLNMPVWRFQLEGAEMFGAQLRALTRGPTTVDVLRTVTTASGFVTEHEEHQFVDGDELTARRLWLCEVAGGRITQAIGYCSGEWDDQLRARHAREAPMLRP